MIHDNFFQIKKHFVVIKLPPLCYYEIDNNKEEIT